MTNFRKGFKGLGPLLSCGSKKGGRDTSDRINFFKFYLHSNP